VIRLVAAALFILATASTAQADRAAADRCAAALSPSGKTIYNRSLNDVLTGQSITDVVSTVTRAMVFAGALSVGDARPAAEAAAACLVMVK
jgi:hypothetical protein